MITPAMMASGSANSASNMARGSPARSIQVPPPIIIVHATEASARASDSGRWTQWYREAIPLAEQRYERYLKERRDEEDHQQ